ncbi:MAG: hypothetical protein AAGA03_09195 [Planctomycetota bacterium]
MTVSDNVTETLESDLVTMDRRRNERRSGDADALDQATAASPRRKKQRRRHIDPTTCERDYSDPEIEFMRAMDDYKHQSGRMFPTCSEVLEVIRALGYVQLTPEQRESLQFDEGDEFDDEVEVDSDHEEGFDDE